MKQSLSRLRELKRTGYYSGVYSLDHLRYGKPQRVLGKVLSIVELQDEILVSLMITNGVCRTITVWRREEEPHE